MQLSKRSLTSTTQPKHYIKKFLNLLYNQKN